MRQTASLGVNGLKGRQHCEMRKKCCLPACSSFLTVFSKAISLKVVKTGNNFPKGFATTKIK